MRVTVPTHNERRSTNCGGPDETFAVTRYVVEDIDIGRAMPNYGGYRQPAYVLTSSDVGRTLEVVRQGDYACWGFILGSVQ